MGEQPLNGDGGQVTRKDSIQALPKGCEYLGSQQMLLRAVCPGGAISPPLGLGKALRSLEIRTWPWYHRFTAGTNSRFTRASAMGVLFP